MPQTPIRRAFMPADPLCRLPIDSFSWAFSGQLATTKQTINYEICNNSSNFYYILGVVRARRGGERTRAFRFNLF
jgi:hypothetical protein